MASASRSGEPRATGHRQRRRTASAAPTPSRSTRRWRSARGRRTRSTSAPTASTARRTRATRCRRQPGADRVGVADHDDRHLADERQRPDRRPPERAGVGDDDRIEHADEHHERVVPREPDREHDQQVGRPGCHRPEQSGHRVRDVLATTRPPARASGRPRISQRGNADLDGGGERDPERPGQRVRRRPEQLDAPLRRHRHRRLRVDRRRGDAGRRSEPAFPRRPSST